MDLHSFRTHGQQLWLSAERTIFWEEQKALIVSDLHLGKTGHFRKSGIPVPQNLYKEDLQRLFSQVQYFNARQLVVVGDMVHSRANLELELFSKWRKDLGHLSIQLVRGNHDILPLKWYRENEIYLHEESLVIDDFCFQHDPAACGNNGELASYSFSGHIHPGIVISGMGKQSLRFPCFYFSENTCILPAFSRFTGAASVDPKPGETVFAIVEKTMVQLEY